MSKPALVPAPLTSLASSHDVRSAAGHVHVHQRGQTRRLRAVLLLTSAFFCVQFAGAIWADSDVLRAEALHVLTDVAALSLAYLAAGVAYRRPTSRFTYGLRRAEPVAAIFNGLLVLGATALLVGEAVADLSRASGPRADRMLYVAAIGVVVNGVSAWLIHGAIGAHHHTLRESRRRAETEPACEDLNHRHIAQHARRHGHGHTLNLRAAWLHLFGDALGSLAALVAAVSIRFGASPKADPIAAFVVAVVLVYGSIRLLKDAVFTLLESSPPHLSVDEVRAAIMGTRGVARLHDLHVWSLGEGHDAITAHVSADQADSALGERVAEALRQRFRAEYVTIQVEPAGVTCHAETFDSQET